MRPVAHFFAIASILAIVVVFGMFPVQVHGPGPSPTLQAARFSLPGIAAAVPTPGAGELVAGPVPLTVVVPPVTEDAVLLGRDQTAGVRASIEERQQAAAEPATVEAASGQGRIPIAWEYEVKEGDTVSGIAQRFGIGTRYIVWNNVDTLDNENSLPVGIILQVPAVEGIIHSVRVGETVSEIAMRFDASIDDIVEFRANGFNGDPNNLRDGSLILVPGGRIVPLAPSTRPSEPAVEAPSVQPGPGTGGSGWRWPAQGMITNLFGPGHPLGIDIAMPMNTPIYASEAGQVTFAGGNPCCSYGYHIILDHGNGYETLYAHVNQFAVANGEWVERGQLIAYSGNTGRSTGPHLHFEVRRNGQWVDPMGYLP